jgi:polyphosphate kinase 2 (PPK2 family)
MGRLDDVDLTQQLSREEQDEALGHAWKRLQMLRLQLGGQLDGELGPPLCIVFEGLDAAGKGGCIKRLVYPMDPRHYSVISIEAPSSREKRHHFLWRFWPRLPGHGGMVVFDRSWYGRVLVERVEGLADEAEWRRSYREITEFERMLTDEGTILVKFWLHVSEEEQLRRFESRRRHPTKRWKLTDEDWRNRAKRQAYDEAAEDMFALTDSAHAPWHVIAADSKRHARVEVCRLVIDDVERGLRAQGLDRPPTFEEAEAALRAELS